MSPGASPAGRPAPGPSPHPAARRRPPAPPPAASPPSSSTWPQKRIGGIDALHLRQRALVAESDHGAEVDDLGDLALLLEPGALLVGWRSGRSARSPHRRPGSPRPRAADPALDRPPAPVPPPRSPRRPSARQARKDAGTRRSPPRSSRAAMRKAIRIVGVIRPPSPTCGSIAPSRKLDDPVAARRPDHARG